MKVQLESPVMARTHTHPFNGPLSGTTRVSRYQKGETNLDLIWILLKQETEWQWHQLGHMQVCTSLKTDNHTSTPPLSFLQAGCPSCRPTNSVKGDIMAQCRIISPVCLLPCWPVTMLLISVSWQRHALYRVLFYTVSQKKRHRTLAHNFTKYLPIFKILSQLDSVRNL